jgi:hypothetical protein
MVTIDVKKDLINNTFSEKKFLDKLDEMIGLLQKIQANTETQHTASVKIGEKLAKEFIPTNLLKRKDVS